MMGDWVEVFTYRERISFRESRVKPSNRSGFDVWV